MIDKIIEKLKKSLFYDRWTCNVCGKEIFDGFFCDECLKTIVEIGENKCLHCGRRTAYETNFCNSCIEKNLDFDMARSVYEYGDTISIVIKNFKYNNFRYLRRFFAEKLTQKVDSEGIDFDIVTYVPMTKEREDKRGFNQAKLIASEFCKLKNIELTSCIKKVKETKRQANLTKAERLKNLESSFKCDKKMVNGKVVLLIDDVLTTGTTSNVIAKELKDKGAIKVIVLTIASVSL